jgi:predicted alpha-1,2-mannosidase
MIGTHADAVIADAYVNGFRDYDTKLAYEAVRKNAMVPPDGDSIKMWGDRDRWTSYEARGGLSYYHSLGYIPVDKTRESVSRTIEFGIDDYSIAQMAKDLGKQEDYDFLIKNSKNYRNLYNAETGFMTARYLDGSWHVEPPLAPDVNVATHPPAGFTEGNAWTYLFGALHDPVGMIALMGGQEKFASKLEENFNGNHYRHDNEPGHHYIYLFDYCGKPWKTQELIRKHTSDENFRNEPLGINGNDDCGQMSAWYIFGTMGFYPVTPASGMYAIGAPQFPELVINYSAAGEARRLEILANHLSRENKYVQKVTLDGTRLQRPFISYQDIVSAKKLVFEMGPEPNYNWK